MKESSVILFTRSSASFSLILSLFIASFLLLLSEEWEELEVHGRNRERTALFYFQTLASIPLLFHYFYYLFVLGGKSREKMKELSIILLFARPSTQFRSLLL